MLPMGPFLNVPDFVCWQAADAEMKERQQAIFLARQIGPQTSLMEEQEGLSGNGLVRRTLAPSPWDGLGVSKIGACLKEKGVPEMDGSSVKEEVRDKSGHSFAGLKVVGLKRKETCNHENKRLFTFKRQGHNVSSAFESPNEAEKLGTSDDLSKDLDSPAVATDAGESEKWRGLVGYESEESDAEDEVECPPCSKEEYFVKMGKRNCSELDPKNELYCFVSPVIETSRCCRSDHETLDGDTNSEHATPILESKTNAVISFVDSNKDTSHCCGNS